MSGEAQKAVIHNRHIPLVSYCSGIKWWPCTTGWLVGRAGNDMKIEFEQLKKNSIPSCT